MLLDKMKNKCIIVGPAPVTENIFRTECERQRNVCSIITMARGLRQVPGSVMLDSGYPLSKRHPDIWICKPEGVTVIIWPDVLNNSDCWTSLH